MEDCGMLLCIYRLIDQLKHCVLDIFSARSVLKQLTIEFIS